MALPNLQKHPQFLQSDVIYLKNDDVKHIKESSESILSAMQGLSTKFGTFIGGINDRLTSLSNQINSTITEPIESLASSTNIIKSALDQNETKFSLKLVLF